MIITQKQQQQEQNLSCRLLTAGDEVEEEFQVSLSAFVKSSKRAVFPIIIMIIMLPLIPLEKL